MAKNPKEGKVKDGLYKRGNTWCIRVVIEGRLIRKAVGPLKATAEAVLAELKKERAVSRLTGESQKTAELLKKREKRTFREVAHLYLEERPHLKASTQRGYAEILKNYLFPAFGDTLVHKITEQDVAKFQAAVSKRVSATRTNNIMGPLRYILKYCVRRKLIAENPAQHLSSLREEEPDIDPLNETELEKALSNLLPHHKPLFTCLAWTGARPDELFALRWSDIDFERNEMNINKGRVRGKEGTTKTKTGKRIFKMLSIVRETLQELKRTGPSHIEGYVFLTKKGQPYDKHVDREWRTALKKAGVRHRPAYQLRHTFASLCLQNGAQPTWVAKTLGHTSPQITFKHYARFIDDNSSSNEQRIEQYLAGRSKSKNVGDSKTTRRSG